MNIRIPIIPSWEAIIPLLVEVAANGQAAEARHDAMSELRRLARIVDKQNELARAEQAMEGEQ